ncbi:hypothetical protein QBC35DRAFT_504172 [Podospora australis]|uniref:Uncharacterized protein n=1 Tax=Podospora australis TaxID=1536484 RepID=A0AAN7AFZ3_9PEZI|nr:hypothetical protein QBC35DRAFT_504172 [Podospora australis]
MMSPPMASWVQSTSFSLLTPLGFAQASNISRAEVSLSSNPQHSEIAMLPFSLITIQYHHPGSGSWFPHGPALFPGHNPDMIPYVY